MNGIITVSPKTALWKPRFEDDGRRSYEHATMVARRWMQRHARRHGWITVEAASVEFVRDPAARRTFVYVSLDYTTQDMITERYD